MIAITLIIIISFYWGFYMRDIRDKIKALDEILKAKVDKKPAEEPKSALLDLTDPVQNAMYEQKKMMDKLNGK